MVPATGPSSGTPIYDHESGAEIRRRSIGYAAMHGDVHVESAQDEGVYLNGYYYEQTTRPTDQLPSQVSHPWSTVLLSRTDFEEICDVVNRQTSGDEVDWVGVETGHLYVAYDTESGSIGRNMDTEERVYAVPEYQRSLVEFKISHLSGRGTDDGLVRIYGYGPDGPSAAERTI